MVDRQFIFQTTGHGFPEAERFVLLMRRLEAFSGVRVLTYALMSNHFHLLCEVPQAQELSEAELLERIQAGYDHYSGVEKQSHFPRRRYANTPTRRHASPLVAGDHSPVPR